MLVKEMINQCDATKVWEYMYEDFFKNRNYTQEKLDYFKTSIIKAVDIAKGITEKIDSNWIIVVGKYYDDLEPENKTIYMGSSLYKKTEITNNFREDAIVETNTDVSNWTKDQFVFYFTKTKPFITTWGYEFSEWDEVLGFDIWDGSINEYGINRCTSAVLFEMTYCGFKPENVKERTDEIFKRTEQLDEAQIKVPEKNNPENLDEIDCDFNQEEFKLSDEDMAASLKVCFENWKNDYIHLKKIFSELMGE